LIVTAMSSPPQLHYYYHSHSQSYCAQSEKGKGLRLRLCNWQQRVEFGDEIEIEKTQRESRELSLKKFTKCLNLRTVVACLK